MKEKIIKVLKKIFGIGILVSLFGGGITLLGYIVALCIGGPVAADICHFIYKQYLPVIIYISTSSVVLGLIILYISKDHALTASKGKKKKHLTHKDMEHQGEH